MRVNKKTCPSEGRIYVYVHYVIKIMGMSMKIGFIIREVLIKRSAASAYTQYGGFLMNKREIITLVLVFVKK